MYYASELPDYLKRASANAKVEVPPNVAAILRENVNAIFVSTAAPTNIRYSSPVPAKHGGWETCVEANLTGATGKPLGQRRYFVNITDNQIGDRRDGVDRCAKETYQPL